MAGPKSAYTFLVVADVPRGLRLLPENLCGFRIVVVLCGFYGNTRHKPCESNETDRYHVMAAPPLVHRKGHAESGD